MTAFDKYLNSAEILWVFRGYHKEYLGVDYYCDIESAYAGLLEKTKEQIDLNSDKVEIYLFPLYVDSLWQMMQESYISDLSEQYGITISDFTGEISEEALVITLI